METVQFERISSQLVTQLGAVFGSQIHMAFRQQCRALAVPEIYALIPKMSCWDALCEGSGRTAVAFGVNNPTLKSRREYDKKKLAFLLARQSLRIIRGFAGRERRHHEDDANTRLYRFIDRDLTFDGYRVLCELPAGELLALMVTAPGDCPYCRIADKRQTSCDGCGATRCPIHCKCSKKGKLC